MSHHNESRVWFQETLQGRPYEVEAGVIDDGRAEVRVRGCDADGQIVAELTGLVPVQDLSELGRLISQLSVVDRRSRDEPAPQAYDVATIRKRHPNAYARWNSEEDEQLRQRHREGASLAQLSRELGRNPGGIRSRLASLGEVAEPASGTDTIYQEFGRPNHDQQSR